MNDPLAKVILKALAAAGSEIMQKASYELGDILNAQDPLSRLFYLAQMRLIVNGVIPTLDEREQAIIDWIVEHSEMTILPVEFDNRQKKPEAPP